MADAVKRGSHVCCQMRALMCVFGLICTLMCALARVLYIYIYMLSYVPDL